ncbi:MAG: hypothetical protein ACREXS_20680 [Gammaproteobacteria bacterium]
MTLQCCNKFGAHDSDTKISQDPVQAREVLLDRRSLETLSSKRKARARAIHWLYDSVMPDYRRAHVPGGTYFFTVNTYRCQTFLTDTDVRSALREAIGTLRLTHASVIEPLLPNHRQLDHTTRRDAVDNADTADTETPQLM